METIKNICIHHYGASADTPLAKTSYLTLEDINQLHKARWPDFPSELNPYLYVGYNMIIFPDGSVSQTRYIGEETAAQKGHNLDTVSICLAGNFTKGAELPTWEQKGKLKSIIFALIQNQPDRVGLKVKSGTVIGCNPVDIYPHRILQPNHTECYGNALEDGWGRSLVDDSTSNLERVKSIIMQLLQSMLKSNKLGSRFVSCQDSDVRG